MTDLAKRRSGWIRIEQGLIDGPRRLLPVLKHEICFAGDHGPKLPPPKCLQKTAAAQDGVNQAFCDFGALEIPNASDRRGR
jgi:hypothetical protein